MKTFFLLVGLALLLWFIYSVVCIIYPFRPFRRRSRAMLSAVVCFIAFGVVAQISPKPDAPSPPPSPEHTAQAPAAVEYEQPTEDVATDTTQAPTALDEPVVSGEIRSASAIPAPCGDGGLALSDNVAVTGEFDLRVKPSSTASRVKNEKASRILKKTIYHQVDNTTVVRRQCAQDQWTEVRIVKPDWLTHVKGWVPNDRLRTIERTASGKRVYVEEDFYWDADASRHKAAIVAVVNKIIRENKQCSSVETGSVAKSPTKSKPNDPVFFVTCNTGFDAFNVWFRPRDADASADTFAALIPIDKRSAVDACEEYAKSVATHKSTVEFSRVWDLAYVSYPSGRARVVSSFTAKNSFNLELKFRIDCLFEGDGLLEVSIAEARD